MRLICPNCGAQYEVPTEVIPETGRDVQCSDCGTTWFQHHPDHPAAEDHLEAAPESSEPDAPEARAETLESDAVPPQEEADYTAEEEVVAEEVTAPEPGAPAEEDVATEERQDFDEAEPEPTEDAPQMQPDESALPQEQETTSEELEAADETDAEAVETTDDWPPAHEPEPEPETEPETEPEPDLEADAETEAPDKPPEAPEDEATAGEPEKKRLDNDIAAVLRQEAERETRAREEERRSGLETQPELGLTRHDSTARQRSLEAEARMARLRGDDLAADIPTTVVADAEISDDLGIDPSSRSNLLPDIDEINSSLETERGGDTQPPVAPAERPPARGGSGFRTGFRLAVLLALFGLLVYLFAAQLAGAVPALEGVLTSYVAAIDGIRAQLSGLVESLASSVEEPGATE